MKTEAAAMFTMFSCKQHTRVIIVFKGEFATVDGDEFNSDAM